MAAKHGLTSVIRTEPPDLARILVTRGLMTEEQILACRRIRRDVFERFDLTYTLGQIVFERLFTSNPELRPRILARGGIAELLDRDIPIDFWKFPADAHDRFMDRLKREGRVKVDQYSECFKIQYELSKLGILKHIGELLIDKGYVERSHADEYLRPPADPERLPCLAFDRIAVYNGMISEGAAASARDKQERILADTGLSVPIGRIFYETGQLRRVEVEAILDAQVRIGRLGPEEIDLKILKLSRVEEQAMTTRLLKVGSVSERDLFQAQQTAKKLGEYGLRFAAVEVLWLEKKVPDSLIQDVVAHQREHLGRLEPRRPEVYLSLAPSAQLLLQQRPADIPEADFLFGQCARIAGAVDREELDRATAIFLRCRRDLGLPLSLGQILFDLHEHDPKRFEALRTALAELRELLGYAYEVRSLRLSPLEYEIVAERLESADAELEAKIREANEVVSALSEVGLEKDVTEILLARGVLTDSAIGDLVGQREARDQRLVGGWREREGGEEESTATGQFLQAFSTDGATIGWSGLLFGHLAIAEGFIDPPQLVRALYVQMRAREAGLGKPIGEVLVELGHMNQDQVQSLLKLQANRLAATRPGTSSTGRLERDRPAPSPEGLTGEDQILFRRLHEGGILDEAKLTEYLALRDSIRELGLVGSLVEIVRTRGEVDRELVDGILLEAQREEERERADSRRIAFGAAVPTDLEIKQAYTKALAQAQATPVAEVAISDRVLLASQAPGRGKWRIVFGGVAVAATFLAFGPLVGFVASLWNEDPPPPLLASPGSPPPASAPADPRAFEASMIERGLVRKDGRWTTEDARPPVREEGHYAEVRRDELEKRLSGEGFVKVEGGWVHPEALERLAAGRERAAQGEVREAGAWRSPKAYFRPERVRTGDPGAAEIPPRVSSLEAMLRIEPRRTMIGLRFDTDLPPGARLVVTIASRERADSPFYTTIVRPDATGRVSIVVEPLERVLAPGVYVVGLAYRPEFQPREIAMADSRHEVRTVEVSIGSAAEIESALASRRAELRQVHEKLAGLAAGLEAEVQLDRRVQWANAHFQEVESYWKGLRAWGGPGDPLSMPRDLLFRAARLLAECLAGLGSGASLDEGKFAQVRLALEEAAALLVSE